MEWLRIIAWRILRVAKLLLLNNGCPRMLLIVECLTLLASELLHTDCLLPCDGILLASLNVIEYYEWERD